MLSGEIIITLKIIDLTTSGAKQLRRLINVTKAVMSSGLNGSSYYPS